MARDALHNYSVILGERVIEFQSDQCADELERSLKILQPFMQAIQLDVDCYVEREDGRWSRLEISSRSQLSTKGRSRRDAVEAGQDTVFPYCERNSNHPVNYGDLNPEYQTVGENLIHAYRYWRHHQKMAQSQSRGRLTRIGSAFSERGSSRDLNFEERIEMVDSILMECPEQYQTLFDLRVRKDYTPEQTARMMHVSISTFNRYWRVLKKCLGYEAHRNASRHGVALDEVLYDIPYPWLEDRP